MGGFLHTEKVILKALASEKSKKCFVGYFGGSRLRGNDNARGGNRRFQPPLESKCGTA